MGLICVAAGQGRETALAVVQELLQFRRDGWISEPVVSQDQKIEIERPQGTLIQFSQLRALTVKAFKIPRK